MKESSKQGGSVVFLIGFSGSGKSTIGPRLARRLGADFYDTDQLVEVAASKSIDQIFGSEGEAAFRAYEARVIVSLIDSLSAATVIALGGGAFQNRESRKLIGVTGLVVYLSCSSRELYRRLKDCSDRPLLSAGEKRTIRERKELRKRIEHLMSVRRANYRKADIIYSTTGKNIGTTVSDIVRLIRSRSWHK